MAHLIDEILGRHPDGAREAFREEMLARIANSGHANESTQGIVNSLFGESSTAELHRALWATGHSGDMGPKAMKDAHRFIDDEKAAKKDRKDKKDVKESIDEVEVPRSGPSVGMLLSNPIQRLQNQDADPGQYGALHGKSPARLADRKTQLSGFPAETQADTDAAVRERAPHLHAASEDLTSNYLLTTLPDHEFDPDLDSEAEFYPLFSMYRTMGLPPVQSQTEADDSNDVDDDEDEDGESDDVEEGIEESGLDNFSLPELFYAHGKRMAKTGEATKSIEDHVRSKYGKDAFDDLAAHGVLSHLVVHPESIKGDEYSPEDIQKAVNLLKRKAAGYKQLKESEDLDESVVDPTKLDTLGLWDEHARRSAGRGSGSRLDIIKRIEDHVKSKRGEEGLRKMKLHSDLSQVLHTSSPSDAPMVKALIDNMRAHAVRETS